MLKNNFRRHPFLMSALALALVLTIVFAIRFAMDAVYWSRHHEQTIRPWMTVGYIGRSWDLKPNKIDEAGGLPKPEHHPLTLAEIARQRGVPVSEVIEQVEAAITSLKAQRN